MCNFIMDRCSSRLVNDTFPLTFAAHSTYAVAMREGIPGTVRCREPRECRGKADVDITWCVNVYHPSERIELCWNRSSGETNATDYALRLDLSDAFGDQVCTCM